MLLTDSVPKGKTRRRKCAFYKGQLCWISSVLQDYIFDHPDCEFQDILAHIVFECRYFLEKDVKVEDIDFYPDLKGYYEVYEK